MQVNQDECLTHGSYSYRAFGLDIASNVLLPQLLPAGNLSGEPEVTIYLGKVPAAITDVVEETDIYQVSRNELIMRMPGVANYYATNGNRMIVELEKSAEGHVVCEFLLDLPLGVLLLQRGIIALHGSAVVVDGHAVVFTGVCGAGKSTMAAAFRERGYAMLTDDVAVLSMDENCVAWVQPACPKQNLRRDSAEAVGIMGTDQLPVFNGGNGDKFILPVNKEFCQVPAPLGAVYELWTGKSPGARISRLTVADRLAVLMNNTWLGNLIAGFGLTKALFEQCLKIGRKTPISRLIRPQGAFSLEDQVRLVEEDLRGDGDGSKRGNLAR